MVAFASAKVLFPGVAQLVARLLWEQDAAGSSPVTRTMLIVLNGLEPLRTIFFMHISIFYVSEQGILLLFCYAVIAFGIYETETPCLVSFVIP